MTTTNLEKQLGKYSDFSTFRTGQKEIIQDVLDGHNVLGILPTGSGKSLCYQLPARIVPGAVLVVSPLISLMLDQVKQLKSMGFKDVIAFNSFMNHSDKQEAFKNLNNYKLIFVSPEMLQNPNFFKQLLTIRVSLFVVDEAHCISQWGHEFRPDYLKLKEIIKELDWPTVLALSATATPEVQKDIEQQLGCQSMVKHIHQMDRENISFSVEHVANYQEKLDYIVPLLKRLPVPTMVYFTSRHWTEKVSQELAKRLPNLRVSFYHGGMEQTDRILIQQQFMNDQLDVICCTSAFGMGIDKSNIRLIVHFHLPTQVESFIQEIGRAGRDGASSVSLVLVAPNDDFLPKKLISSELPDQVVVAAVIKYLSFLQQEKRAIPEDDSELLERFQLSETQWRFLRYHFEKRGIIKGTRILYNFDEWKKTTNEINQLITSRLRYKEEKLAQLLRWVDGDVCRRESLFSSFQNSIKEPSFCCCDRCDFSFANWDPVLTEKKQVSFEWKEDFKRIMLQGRHNE